MKRYWNYFKYVIIHKWWVFVYCCKFNLIFRGIIHDWSKLLPSEFFPYANHFFNDDGSKKSVRNKDGYYKPTDTGDSDFDLAWLHHVHYNEHHWQHWCLGEDETGIKIFSMSDVAIIEMFCDWCGAGRAQKTPGVKAWYENNQHKLQLHPETREKVNLIIDAFYSDVKPYYIPRLLEYLHSEHESF